jgi:hypothetical protein
LKLEARQGFLLSPFLFHTIIATIASAIREEKEIQGRKGSWKSRDKTIILHR